MSGSVYRGYWKDKRVAVKVFKPDIKISDFIKELSIMSIVRHKNLVRCYGGVTKGGKFMIIAELLQENLNSLLAFNEIELSLGLRLQMAVDVARALTYLHNHCNLMHRDLKTLNLLVTTVEGPELVVKVCDFGVSRVIDKKRAMTGNIGTVAWIAPEIFQQKKYTEKADIYSFGIVMWEIITRQTPFGNLSSFGIPVAVIKGDRPPFAKEKVPSSLKKLVRSCWSSNQKKRPPVHKVLDSLLKIYNNLAPSETSQKNIDITPIFKSPLQRSATRSLWTRRTTRQLNYVPTTETQTLIYNSPPPKTPSRSLKRRSRSRVNSLQQEVLPKVPEQVNTSITDEESSEEAQLENENEPEEHDESEIVDFAQNTNTSTVTCIIPPIWSLPTAQLEVKVNRHFSRLKQDLEDGTILVSRQRYLLFRAENFVSDIIRTIQVSFDLPKNEEISDIANSFLYSLGSYIGKEDSKELFKRTALTDKVTKITSAFVNIAYTGLAYANLLPESEINEKHLETTVLHVELEKSYEFKRQDKDPLVFTMAAGYIAGWCESVIGQRFQYVEVNQVEEKLVCQFIANDDKKSARVSTSKNHTFVKTKDSNVNWLPKLIKTTKKKQNTSEVELQVAAKKFPSPAPFEAEDTIDEINNKTAEKFDSFFLDPTQATVELAEEHCLLLQTNSIATGIHELFTKSLKSENSTLYSSKLLYNFGFQVAKTNFKWFMEITRLGDDVIERALSLPVNLAYLGWCDLHFVNMSEMQELSKSKENFSITITSETAYEATSIKRWLQNNSSKYKPKCCCFVLSGYIAGWFESCFGISCKCIETECRLNDANCTFFVYHNNKLIPKTKDPSSIEIIRYTSIVSLSGSSEERRLTPNEEKISLIMKPQLSDVSLVSKDRKQLVRSKSTDSARSSVITDAKMAKEMFSGSLTSEVDNKYGISPVPGQIQPTKETRRSKEKTTRKGKRSKSTHKSAEKKLKMREEKDFFRTTDDFTLPPSPPLPATASPLNFIPVSIFSTAPRSNSPAPGPAKKAPQARRLSINKRIHYEITKTLTGEKEKVPSELHDDINKKAQSSGIPSRKFGSKHSSSEVPELINNEDDST
uniref:Protein kinase domain-containing protein n=1 Tax=Arcella intermedia TaxID=1963864 RepID=A0A6B2KWY3_9EUKA